jgi:hypothetical protein
MRPRMEVQVKPGNRMTSLAIGRVIVVGIILSVASLAQAQVDRAGLSGTVADPSGRVVPQTHVTAVQNDTGLRRETISSLTGTYDIPELPVGVYSVTFSHDGFKTLTFVDVVQAVGDANLEREPASFGWRGTRRSIG